MGQWVSQWVIDSFRLEIAIASTKLASLFDQNATGENTSSMEDYENMGLVKTWSVIRNVELLIILYEQIGPGEEFTGPKKFQSQAFPAYASSNLW